MRIDMHLHTRASFDCLTDPDALMQRLAACGIDRTCITDHNEIATAVHLHERYGDRVIVGEEVRTAEGVDIIGLFLHERIPKGTPAQETCRRVREQGGLVYVPHPFAGGKGGGGRILPHIETLVDVVEAFNARIHDPALNARAAEWARARDLPVGAGSDAHTLGEVGRAWVELPAFECTPAGLLAALRQGTTGGVLSPHSVHLASTWAKVRKWFDRRHPD
jgi:predicted metal-dependent phosphoesterase TrpH